MAARVFYGWFVVAGAFAITFVGFGSAYTFSAFVHSLQTDFAASRGSVSLVFSLAGFLYFGLGIVSGPLADRWGARRLGIIGMVLIGLGLCAASMVRSRRFISLYAACLICSFGIFVPFVHLIPYALDHGVPQSAAVLLLGAVGVGSTAGRFFLGGLADRLGRELALLLMFAGMACALLIWVCSAAYWGMCLFALVYGVFYGGYVAVLPALVMDYFGGRNVGGIIGVLYTSIAVGTLIGPSAAGFAFDVSHSYVLPILASAGGNLIAVLIMAEVMVSTSKAAALSGARG